MKVRGTHFGRIEDLRTDNTTNQNTDQLGYTDAAVDLHTDQPFLPKPPRFQLLQSIRRPQNQLRFMLEPGDFLICDNHRMLHVRTAFAGPRWVRGINFDR